MIASPSRGNVMAEVLTDCLPYQVVMGEVGQELTLETAGEGPPRPVPSPTSLEGAADNSGAILSFL